ncbi:efflux transporter outer membrane subunit [Erythrobacter sp.]|uniref:efflux transporter outer membrane subunit n=1 Tax=Erythrobacter sp. TaxID=1042 RepID=UPI0025D92B4F|nr:efflux transporter outer membrane subunit [Erythrobacter sp.]
MSGKSFLVAAMLNAMAFGMASCAVGPDYARPSQSVPLTVTTLPEAPEISQAAPDARWWQAFGDPLLDRLVNDAVANNADLEAAAARIAQARALRAVAAGGARPNVAANSSVTRSQTSENAIDLSGLGGGGGGGGAPIGGIGAPQTIYSVGTSASWEIDLFGRIGRRVEAAEARVGIAQEDRNALLLTVIADTVQNYAELRIAQEQLGAVEANLETTRETVRLTQLRFDKGLASQFDLSRAEADARSAEAQLAPLGAQVRANNAAIAALTGQFPAELGESLMTPAAIAVPSDAFPAGVPSDVLRRRPDIRLAERRLAAETADIGGEIADLYPSFSLSGLFGFSSIALDTLFAGGSQNTSIGAALNWPVFSGGRARAEIAEARAGADEARALYRGAVLRAFEDADRALTAYVYAQRRLRVLEAVLAERSQSYGFAKLRFEQGLDSQLVLLDTQRQLIAARSELARGKGDVLVATVGAYRALGGGWDLGEIPDQSEQP